MSATDRQGGVTLDGESLTLADLVRVARDPTVPVSVTDAAVERVRACRARIEAAVEEYRAYWSADHPIDDHEAPLIYGVTTGFGEFKRIPVPPEQLENLHRNILLSHAAGIGDNTNRDDLRNYFPAEVVRAALLLRLNTFLRGHSGVRTLVLDYILAMLNRGIIPLVPIRGSVGSSGDLCPLAHLFVTLLGEGRYYRVTEAEDLIDRAPTLRDAARELPEELGLPLFAPSYKEGLALTNGVSFSAALLALAVHDATVLADTADLAAALTFEALAGRTRCLDPKVHAVRGLRGQIDSAANMRAALTGSSQIERSLDVQDAYSLRCAPQVHGASRDAIAYARMVVEREMNAATDNPLFFAEGEPWDLQFSANLDGEHPDPLAYSAGNFHGEPIGMAADFLAIAVAEIANISERRTQMLLDRNHNRNLPPNLVAGAGVNSGFMLAQYTSASLVSENKILCHPASVDSIPTSANIEDHVAMATTAARKLRTVAGNAHGVLAIELLVGCQAVDWRVGMKLPATFGFRTARSTADTLGDVTDPGRTDAERFAERTASEHRERIASALGRGTSAVYRLIRTHVEPLVLDRRISLDIRMARKLVELGAVPAAAREAGVELVAPGPLGWEPSADRPG